MGYQVHLPEGTFYLLPRCVDDWAFAKTLSQQQVLVMPGEVLEMPGRMASRGPNAADPQPFHEHARPARVIGAGGEPRDVVGRRVGSRCAQLAEVVDGVAWFSPPPPTPRMNSRPPRSRKATSSSQSASISPAGKACAISQTSLRYWVACSTFATGLVCVSSSPVSGPAGRMTRRPDYPAAIRCTAATCATVVLRVSAYC